MAVTFQQVLKSRLYQSTGNPANAGWWGFQVSSGTTLPTGDITLADALNSTTLNTNLVYAAVAPDVSSEALAEAFVSQIDEIMSGILSPRAIIFLPAAATLELSVAGVQLLGLQQGTPVTINTGLTSQLTELNTGAITLIIASGSTLSVPDDGESITLDGGSNPSVSLGGLLSSDTYQPQNTASLAMSGPAQGTFQFAVSIRRAALQTELNWGFQLLVPNPDANEPTIRYLTAWLPLADGTLPNPGDMLGFACQVNILNPNNLLQPAGSVTKLFFTGENSNGTTSRTILTSFYRTNAGATISLLPVADGASGQLPASLIITNGYKKTPNQNGFNLAPDGDFILTVDDAATGAPATMLCGMSGTETIAFLPYVESGYAGYRLRFSSLRPAFPPVFPLQPYSPVSAPIDPKALLLDGTFLTSWCSVVAPPADASQPFYTAAPKGADLFGLPPASKAAAAGSTLLTPASPGMALQPTAIFPLIPFSGFTSGPGDQDLTQEMLAQVERQILSPTRRDAIGAQSSAASHPHRTLGLLRGAAQASPFYATTPAGFISKVGGDGIWSQLLLAQVMTADLSAVSLQMGFTGLQSQLQAAFQTDNLFLVAANGKYLGVPTGGTFMPPATSIQDDKNLFFNTINIGEWSFRPAVGEANRYGDYRNVMLVKGVKGKLIDLVVSPDKWTRKDLFSAPSTLLPDGTVSAPDLTQLVPLSAWISQYFAAALAQKDSVYFSDFCNLIQSEDWTGVLLLKVDIAGIPKDLAGIIAGVDDPQDFYAHHIGIDISQIDAKTVQQKDGSSLFGLVYYVSPDYDDSQPAHPVAPADPTQPFAFELLTLKALFRNSALKQFDSLAQLILNRVFGADVAQMGPGGNIYNAILLQGALQKHGDAAVYSLASTTANLYEMSNNILTLVEVDSAVMSTRDDGSVSGEVVSWIALSGFMNFAVLTDTTGNVPAQPDFDIFSFGGADGDSRQGLGFNNLGLRIRFAKPKTSGTVLHTFALQGAASAAPELTMVESEISFNLPSSTPREDSLYNNFQLELLGLQTGDAKTTPDSLSYLTVATPYGLQGVSSGAWHGMRFKLNLGTPGALAGKINLNSTLLVAWSDASGAQQGSSGYQAAVAIQLPGTGSGGDVFSLQSVLKLSIGVVQLFYNAPAKSFLLVLNEIALKFLGLLKVPPNGATAFFLFGNSDASSSTGLGWYAIYNQDAPKKSGAATNTLLSDNTAAGLSVGPTEF